MYSQILILGMCLCIVGCVPKHKSASDIYSSGKVENFNDFVRTDTSKIDDDTLLDCYVYKFDTAFRVDKRYTYTYSTAEKTFRNYYFYYKGKMEGRIILHHPDGSVIVELDYKDGEKVRSFVPKK